MGWKLRPGKRVILAFFLALSSLSTCACKRFLHRSTGDAGASQVDEAALAQEAANDEQLRAKLTHYVDCMNNLSNDIRKSRDKVNTYFPSGTITGREVFAEIPKLSTDAASTCMFHVTIGRSLPPADAKLEAAGLEFADAASNVDDLTKRMGAYLDARGYKKDKWEKGKQLYPQLVPAWKRFMQADDTLHLAVEAQSRPLEERALARIERQEGRKFPWHKKHTILASRALMSASDPIGDDKEIDLAAWSQRFVDYEKALDELAAYGTEHKADLSNPLVAEHSSVAEANFKTFTTRAADLRRAAKDYGKCLQAAPPKAHTASGKIDRARVGLCTDGSGVWTRSDDLIAKFNQFIGAFNNLPFP